MTAPFKIAIAGGTGKLSQLIMTSLLRNNPSTTIHAIARTPNKMPEPFRSNPSVKLFTANADDQPAIQSAIRGTNIVICTYLGGPDLMLNGQKTLIDACVAEGVPRYMGSDWSFDFRGLKPGDHPGKDFALKYNAYLEEKEKETGGKLKGVHILNGAFMEVLFTPFLGVADVKNDVFKYYGNGDEKQEATTMPDAAEFTARVAADPSATGFFNMLGDSKTWPEMADIYREVYGVKPALERQGSLDELSTKLKTTFQKDPSNMYAWVGMAYQWVTSNGTTYLGKLDDKYLAGYKSKSIKDFMQDHKKEELATIYH
ncbi:MAG: hypothetical protein M1828_003612 [Chrysothrix sp. TS-e1954]|nr:MAG: hypothetical protein M1828_003612 [Chrysothrix sp. TS-e1954]